MAQYVCHPHLLLANCCTNVLLCSEVNLIASIYMTMVLNYWGQHLPQRVHCILMKCLEKLAEFRLPRLSENYRDMSYPFEGVSRMFGEYPSPGVHLQTRQSLEMVVGLHMRCVCGMCLNQSMCARACVYLLFIMCPPYECIVSPLHMSDAFSHHACACVPYHRSRTMAILLTHV